MRFRNRQLDETQRTIKGLGEGVQQFATSSLGAWAVSGLVVLVLYRLVVPKGGGLSPRLTEEEYESLTPEQRDQYVIEESRTDAPGG